MANFKHISIDETSYDAVPAGSYVSGVKGNSETAYRSGNVNITKNNIGLSNVPNVSTNNQTPTFTQASTRANIASGETLSVIMGKIMKFFADLKTVAFTNSYSDLDNKPTIPTVNNGTLTIQKNGSNVQTFTANQNTNATANITVPTKTSELTNDSGYITNAGVTGVKGNNESTYRTGNVNITKGNIGLGSVGNFKAVSTSASQGLSATEKTNALTNLGIETLPNSVQSLLVNTLTGQMNRFCRPANNGWVGFDMPKGTTYTVNSVEFVGAGTIPKNSTNGYTIDYSYPNLGFILLQLHGTYLTQAQNNGYLVQAKITNTV